MSDRHTDHPGPGPALIESATRRAVWIFRLHRYLIGSITCEPIGSDATNGLELRRDTMGWVPTPCVCLGGPY